MTLMLSLGFEVIR